MTVVKYDPITVADPAGKSFTVRAVPRGEMLRGVGTDGSLLSVALEMVVKVAVAALAARSSGWTVGVVRRSALGGERVVHKEHLSADTDVEARMRELARAVEHGTPTDLR